MEIQGLGKKGSKLKPEQVEAQFKNNNPLPPHIAHEILKVIEKCFVDNLLEDGEPVDKFGSLHKDFTAKLNKYNTEVLNKVSTWQEDYERKNGSLDAELAG